MCVHTLTPKKTEKGQSPEYSKIFGKNTIFNEHPVDISAHNELFCVTSIYNSAQLFSSQKYHQADSKKGDMQNSQKN